MKAHKLDKKRYRRGLGSFNHKLDSHIGQLTEFRSQLQRLHVRLDAFEGLFLGLLHANLAITKAHLSDQTQLLQTLSPHQAPGPAEELAAAALYRVALLQLQNLSDSKRNIDWLMAELENMAKGKGAQWIPTRSSGQVPR